MKKNSSLVLLALLALIACSQSTQTPKNPQVEVPSFDRDSSFTYIADQVKFGPRVPNTEAHKQCGNYLADQLRRFGAKVIEQEAVLETYDNKALNAKNIIGSFQPENNNRILLFAHWDTRPFADQDPNPDNHRTPIDGANDGAGACGVLLEIARQISLKQPAVGVDIIFFDAEDWGVPAFDEKNQHLGGYCLGSDYWARNPHIQNYTARFGILLDMVSAPAAQFYKEGYSMESAGHVVKKVWEAALITGYGSYFVNESGGRTEDDHVHVMKHRKIPCIDIIHQDPTTDHGFGSYWHTLNDNLNHVSKETLKATGQTVMYVLYNEK